jgi:hypothetical protein
VIDPVAKALADHAIADIQALLAKVPALPDPKPRITIHGGTIIEGGRFIGRITSDIPFSADTPIRVGTFLTGTASAADLTATDLWVTPVVGATEVQYEVQTTQDLIDEADEVFETRIIDVARDNQGNPLLEVAVGSAFITILDDDVTVPPPDPTTPPALIANPASLMPLMSGANAGVGIYVQPGYTINPDGTLTLFTVFKDKYQANKLGAVVNLRYILDGARLDKRTADPAVFTMSADGHDKRHAALTIPLPVAGTYSLSVRLIDGPTTQMQVEGTDVQIGSYTGQAARIPFHGSSFQSNRYRKPVADYVNWSGLTFPTLPGKPRGVKLVPGLTQSGQDPQKGYGIGSFYIEPWTQHISSLYDTEPHLFQSKSGWPVGRNMVWSDGHNATVAVERSVRKPERNGPRLANQVDPYSTLRFTAGTTAWCVSLRGTVSILDLADGSKRAVAGRVYREDTLPLEYGQHTAAEVEAANYEYLGQAADPDHLRWDTPHDVYPDPRDPLKAVLLDSFKHRVFEIDANVSPARVTLLIGNGKGCEAGPALTAKINRPYACVVQPDGSVVFCCTPTATDAADSAVFELSADRQTVRKVIGHGIVADGANRAQRPFWLCQFEPGFVLFWEHTTGHIKKLNLATGVATFWAFGLHLPDQWGMLVCDVNGSWGKPYDVWMIGSNTSPGNTQFKRYAKDGTQYPGTMLQVSIGTAPQGPCQYFFDSPMHYGWWFDIHPVYGIGAMQGYGNIGVILARLKAADDPVLTYDHPAMGWGRGAYDLGTIPGFPYVLRPSGTALRGRTGQSFLPGVRSVSAALDGKTQTQALQWFRDGADGVHPRPEFNGKAGERLAYFLDYLRDDIPTGTKAPLVPNKPLPKLLTWSATRQADGSVRAVFTTDKPVWAVISDMRSAVPATAYATSHTLTTDADCGPNVVVRMIDLDGMEAQTASFGG